MNIELRSKTDCDFAGRPNFPAYELTFRHDAPVLDVLTAVKEQEGFEETDDLYLIY